MALVDHFAPNAGPDTGAGQNGFEKIPAHQFTDTLNLWAMGATGVTKQSVIDAWELTEEPTPDADETQLNEMKVNYDGKTGNAAKLAYIVTVEASLRLLEAGIITIGNAKTFMELT